MPQAVGILLASAAGITISGTTATVVGSIALGAVAIGGQIALNKLLPAPKLKPSDAQQEVRLTIAPRMRSYGRVRVAGTLWFMDTPASGATNHLYTGLAINHGRIANIARFHVDENEVTINGSTGVMESAPYNFDADNRILYRLGEPVETAYGDLNTIFGIPEMRGDGVATALCRMQNQNNAENQMNTFPGGFPEYRFTIDATVCFDPRNPAHDREDPSTWEFSENPVVVLLNYLLDADGFGIPWERFENSIGQWIEAMHVCEEQIDLQGGGTGDRYRIACTFQLTDRPVDVVARMLSTCDGRLWQRRDGSIGISVGKFQTPGITLSGDQIVGYDIERGQDRLTAIAGVRASYMSPEHDYREHEAEPWPNGVDVAALTEDRVANLDLTWVPSRSQVRRLMKREYKRQTSPWKGTVWVNLAALRVIDDRFVRLQIDPPDLGGLDDTFEIRSFVLDTGRPVCQLEVVQVDASIDEWDPSEEGTEVEFEELGYVSDFSKTGTALDPISEAGATIGQTVLVFGAAATLAATPAGWTLVTSAGPTSSLAIACWSKTIDGSEGSATFLGASGALVAVVMRGVYVPTFSDKDQQVTTSTPSSQRKNRVSPPYAVLAAGACLANQAGLSWMRLNDDDEFTGGGDEADESILHSTGASLSLGVKLTVYGAQASAEDLWAHMTDQGTNGLLSFIMEPGG